MSHGRRTEDAMDRGLALGVKKIIKCDQIMHAIQSVRVKSDAIDDDG